MEATAPMKNTIKGVVNLDVQDFPDGNTVITYPSSKNILLLLISCVLMFVPGCTTFVSSGVVEPSTFTTMLLVSTVLTVWAVWYRFGTSYGKVIVRRREGLVLGRGNIPFEDVADIMRNIPPNPHHAVEMHIKLKDGQQVHLASVRNTNVALALTDTISKMNQ